MQNEEVSQFCIRILRSEFLYPEAMKRVLLVLLLALAACSDENPNVPRVSK